VSGPADGHRPQLDALRAFAVCSVLVCHFWQPAPFAWILRQVDLGFLGVRLFFVLSGFLITRILLASRASTELDGSGRIGAWQQFYVRRALRIFPVYYLILAGALVLGVPPAREAWPWLLTYTSNICAALFQENMRYFGHFWSLAVEEQFYLVWPWLVLCAPQRGLRPLILLAIAVAPIYRAGVFDASGEGWGTLPFACLDSLGAGAMLALAQRTTPSRERLERTLRHVVLPIGFGGYLGLHALAYGSDSGRLLAALHETFYALVCCCVIAAADRGVTGWAGHVLSWRPLVYCGRISYGIYAYHLFVPWALTKVFRAAGHGFPAPGPARLVVASLATFAVAMVSWHLVERPINQLKHHFPYVRGERPSAGVLTPTMGKSGSPRFQEL
jgi:peptidoglycan/LPS O-acetylase OafA/YrhL